LRLAQSAIGSFTILLLGLLLATYCFFWAFYPWRPLAELDIPAWMVKFASNTAQTVRDTRAPLIIMGTSLIGAPVARLKRPDLYQDVLSQAWGHKLNTDLLSAPGAVMSDQAFIVHELFANGKKPALIVLTYSPRDFMDNEVADRILITPTRRVVSFINKRQSFLPASLSPAAINDCLANHTLFADLLRRHWLRSLCLQACVSTGHPLTLWDGARLSKYKSENADIAPPAEATSGAVTDEQKEAAERSKHIKMDLELYNRRYNPYNERRTKVQLQYLSDLLAECQLHHTAVLMVGMPLAPANRHLIKPGIYEQLDSKIRVIASRYNASLTDLNTLPGVTFSDDDFGDSVHLSKQGSQLFLPWFAKCILKSPSFSSAFAKAPH